MGSKVAGLYIIATPIGNLQDITLRALEQLNSSDVILCEDTRVTNKLLKKYDIKSKLLAYTDHSPESIVTEVMELIDSGKVVSLVSDAGTPVISDPGFKLVSALRKGNYHIDSLPGPCAPITALTLSALPSSAFYFGGFLPKTIPSRHNAFDAIKNLDATLIFFETAGRISASLEDALTVLGDRQVVVARELTKLYQEIIADKISVVLQHCAQAKLKGEIVLLISPKEPERNTRNGDMQSNIIELLNQQMTNKDIVKRLSREFDGNKRQLYQLVSQLKQNMK